MNINKYEKLCEQQELLYEQYKETKEKIKVYEVLVMYLAFIFQ